MRIANLIFVLICLWSSPLAIAADAVPSAEMTIGLRLKEMFRVGFIRGTTAIPDTQRIFDSIRTVDPNDARVDYARGLIFLRQLRNKEAQTDFLAATKHPGDPYLPAWQALIWSHFVGKDYASAYDLIVEFAKRIEASDHLSKEEKHEEFYWIGRVMAASELMLEPTQSRETWTQTDKQLTGLIEAA